MNFNPSLEIFDRFFELGVAAEDLLRVGGLVLEFSNELVILQEGDPRCCFELLSSDFEGLVPHFARFAHHLYITHTVHFLIASIVCIFSRSLSAKLLL